MNIIFLQGFWQGKGFMMSVVAMNQPENICTKNAS